MKVVVDMNLSPRWVQVLNAARFEAFHWSSLGKDSASDIEIMAYAIANASVVLTHDLDFGAILAATGTIAPSVVQIRADNVSPEVIGGLVVNALNQMRLELDEGALVTIDADRIRLRILPLKP